jgi:ferric-dicitrate binding protein FerR (iron transport regulator)
MLLFITMSQNDHIVSLIAKQLQGVATPQEAKELQQWLHSDAACQQEYDDMARIWQKSGSIPNSIQTLPGQNSTIK